MARFDPSAPLRIANASGFYGDRFSAAREMLEGGAIDVLTGDYLSELTMFVLWKARQKDPGSGYAVTFLKQMEEILGPALERGVRIVTNAGGLDPGGLAARLRDLAGRLGLHPMVCHLEGDDLVPHLDALEAAGHRLEHMETGRPLAALGRPVLTANAYLGGWGIAQALAAGADVVVCPRVTDAALVVGPAAWRFSWRRDDWDALAGAVVAGHVLECGAQATGGNYAFFREVPGLEHPGFPIAEVASDGSAVITKHPGSGGLVSVGTVTAQLLYEIDGPAYLNPDVVARFDTIRLEQEGPDRVRLFGVRGEPAPRLAKVSLNYRGGYRNQMTFVLTGLDIEAKADLARRTLFGLLGGESRFERVDVRLARTDRADAPTTEGASAYLHVSVKDPDASKVGRAFSSAVVEMALASYPGFHVTSPPGDAAEYGVHWPALLPVEVLRPVVVMPDGAKLPIAPVAAPATTDVEVAAFVPPTSPPVSGRTRRVPFGAAFGARSGDKGGNANLGVWARSDAGYAWLAAHLDVGLFKELVPEARPLEVRRFLLPNLRALNFVVVGLLGEGVASSSRADPQAKALGELLRSRLVELPEDLLDD